MLIVRLWEIGLLKLGPVLKNPEANWNQPERGLQFWLEALSPDSIEIGLGDTRTDTMERGIYVWLEAAIMFM